MAVTDKLGYRLVHERIIPTVKIPHGPTRVLVDELKKMLATMVQVDRICRTCRRKDPKTDKCAAFSSPPKDVSNCPAWTFDEGWNVKVWSETRKYESEKKG